MTGDLYEWVDDKNYICVQNSDKKRLKSHPTNNVSCVMQDTLSGYINCIQYIFHKTDP